eukprot:12404518-Karenia_brevis.AAC.1
MPWEEILEQMNKHRADRNVLDIPRPQDCLKYLLRVHLQVNGVDFKKHLKQVMVRPFVLPALVNFLIDHNHEVFRGRGDAQKLRESMRIAVEKEYPDEEKHLPECDRLGIIPSS